MKVKPMSAQSLGYAQADKRLQILQLVGEHGSISQAARTAGISYKAAWQAIHTLTNLSGETLVDSSVGGSGGGGARLTPAGQRLLDAAGKLAEARLQVLARINRAPGDAVLSAPRTSMRNHMRATVAAVHSDGQHDPMVRVEVALDGGGTLMSSLTRESAELLGLAPGLPLLALCKAAAVRVAAPEGDAVDNGDHRAPQRRNRMHGRALRITRGVQRDEVVFTLAGGQQLVGFADRPNRLRSGSRVVATLDDSAVVMALPA